MAKFYVQSGNLQVVLSARDSRCAAIWAAHRTLSRTLPFLCEDAEDYRGLADLTRLGDTIRVSQRGFDRDDARVFDTLERHHVRQLVDKGLCVTVNSDDPAYFGGYLTDNLIGVTRALTLSRDQVLQIVRNGFEASFLSSAEKQRWQQEIDALARWR